MTVSPVYTHIMSYCDILSRYHNIQFLITIYSDVVAALNFIHTQLSQRSYPFLTQCSQVVLRSLLRHNHQFLFDQCRGLRRNKTQRQLFQRQDISSSLLVRYSLSNNPKNSSLTLSQDSGEITREGCARSRWGQGIWRACPQHCVVVTYTDRVNIWIIKYHFAAISRKADSIQLLPHCVQVIPLPIL